MREAVEALRKAAEQGEEAVLARIVEIEGFSTRPGDDFVAVDSHGVVYGSVLAGLGSDELRSAAASLLAAGDSKAASLTLDVGDKDAVSAGLACGGRAHILLQPAGVIPSQLWGLLGSRAPAALLTREDVSAAVVVDRDGKAWGSRDGNWPVEDAAALLVSGHTGSRRLETPEGSVLVEAWVPDPRVVVVGTGELVETIGSQVALLGWEMR